MKKLFYLFLVLPLVFSSCKKEEEKVQGCTDSQATNYNADADEDDESCMYDISGVWTTTSAVLNGVEQLGQLVDDELTYIWTNGEIGSEGYKAGVMTSYSIGTATASSSDPNSVSWSGTAYLADGTSVDLSVSFNIDFMTNANNMTWRYVNYPTAADTYVKTLVRSNAYSLSDWK